MTVYQLKNTMTDEEFKDWREYDKLEPLHGTDLSLARITMMIAAFMGQKNIEFNDFYVHKKPEVAQHLSPKALNDALTGMFT